MADKTSPKAPAPPVQQRQPIAPQHDVESAPELSYAGEISRFRTGVGNRAIARKPDLIAAKLLTTSNRAAVQRWPWSKQKAIDLDQAMETAMQLDMGAQMEEAMFQQANTSVAAGIAITNLNKVKSDMNGLKVRLTNSTYASEDDKKRRSELIDQAGQGEYTVTDMVARINKALPGIKLQETIASPTVQGYSQTHPQGAAPATRPRSGLAKVEDGLSSAGEGGKQVGFAALHSSRAASGGSLIAGQDKQAMTKNAMTGSKFTPEAPKPDSGSRGLLDNIKSFIDSIKSKMLEISWIKSIVDFLEPLAKYTFLSGPIIAGIKLYTTWSRYSALRDAKVAEEGKDATSSLAQSLIYGFAKVKRALYWHISKFGMALSKTIARLITLLTGGTSALVTESIALATDLASATMFVGRKLKALYKIVRGTRGKAREKNAATIYDSALRGDKSALKLFIAIKPFGTLRSIGNKLSISNIPNDEAGMLTYLHANENRHADIQTELSDSLKSQ